MIPRIISPDELRTLLKEGWEPAGFQPITEPGDSEMKGGTDGFAILIRRFHEMAIVSVSEDHSRGEWRLRLLQLTGDME